MSPSAPIDYEVVVDVRNHWTKEVDKLMLYQSQQF